MSHPKPGIRNVPPPPNSKAGNAYTRFIPREELGAFASWQPGTFGDDAAAAARPGMAAAEPEPAREPSADEWRAQVDAARQAGYQDGYRDGMAALESFKSMFAQQATAQIGALLDAFDRQTQALDAELAEVVTRTALQLAAQVLRHEIATRPALVAQVAAEAVGAVMLSAREVIVRVHPDDLPLVAEGAEETLGARGARLLADATLARGDVVVVSDVGQVDARVAARWAEALRELGHGDTTLPEDAA